MKKKRVKEIAASEEEWVRDVFKINKHHKNNNNIRRQIKVGFKVAVSFENAIRLFCLYDSFLFHVCNYPSPLYSTTMAEIYEKEADAEEVSQKSASRIMIHQNN